jgi:hypothetical protein
VDEFHFVLREIERSSITIEPPSKQIGEVNTRLVVLSEHMPKGLSYSIGAGKSVQLCSHLVPNNVTMFTKEGVHAHPPKSCMKLYLPIFKMQIR